MNVTLRKREASATTANSIELRQEPALVQLAVAQSSPLYLEQQSKLEAAADLDLDNFDSWFSNLSDAPFTWIDNLEGVAELYLLEPGDPEASSLSDRTLRLPSKNATILVYQQVGNVLVQVTPPDPRTSTRFLRVSKQDSEYEVPHQLLTSSSLRYSPSTSSADCCP